MLKRIFLIIVWILPLIITNRAFASEPCLTSEDIGYECYEQNVSFYCENPDYTASLWKKENLIITDIPTTAYPKLTVEGLKQAKQTLDSYISNSPIESSNDTSGKELSPSLEFLQIGRTIYHANMNRVFACAMTSSRVSIIKEMLEVINARFGNTSSEVVTRLKQEQKKLETLQTSGSLKCSNQDKNSNTSNSNTPPTPIRAKLLDSAAYQYCVYRYYLDYLDRNINYNMNGLKNTSNQYQLSLNKPSNEMKTTAEFASTLDKLNQNLRQEVELAKKTFPIALTAFTDMERTFGAHVILTLIYDDYIELRKNLRDFLNPISQLFYKVWNAQSANTGG